MGGVVSPKKIGLKKSKLNMVSQLSPAGHLIL